MKKFISYLLFGIIAVALIWLGVWYNDQATQQSNQVALEQGHAAQQQQTELMQELKMNDVVVGSGSAAKAGDTVSVLYTGTLDNGTVFDASSLHGNQPFTFPLGAGQVIQGWDLGVVGMKIGGKRQLIIPAELAYGSRAIGSIPANSTLHFTVEMLAINGSTSTAR